MSNEVRSSQVHRPQCVGKIDGLLVWDLIVCRVLRLFTIETPVSFTLGMLLLGRQKASGTLLLRFTGLFAIASGFPDAIAKASGTLNPTPQPYVVHLAEQ